MEKAIPGKPFDTSAASWNQIADAINYINSQRHVGGRGGATSCAGFTGDVEIQNSSGQNRQPFEILGIDDSVFAADNPSFKSRIVLSGVVPTLADHAGKFAVLVAPAISGQFAGAVVSGVCVCKVDVQDEDDQFADVADGDCTQLKSNPCGAARILWKESGTGTKWAIVRIGCGNPPIPDVTKDYILGYTAAAGKIFWRDTTDTCEQE